MINAFQIDDRVLVTSSRSPHRGKSGVIHSLTTSGRFRVLMDGSLTQQAFTASGIQLLKKTSTFAIGDRVVITSSRSPSKGRKGTVESLTSTGRFRVLIDDTNFVQAFTDGGLKLIKQKTSVKKPSSKKTSSSSPSRIKKEKVVEQEAYKTPKREQKATRTSSRKKEQWEGVPDFSKVLSVQDKGGRRRRLVLALETY